MRTAIWFAAMEYYASQLKPDTELSTLTAIIVLLAAICAITEDLRSAFGDKKQ